MKIERPELTGRTPEENIAIIDTWIAQTADTLNFLLAQNKDTVTKAELDEAVKEAEIRVRRFFIGRGN